ncbi:rhodanese-like domain-containing protein [Chitinilyticum litopenaei]|uniref:rhodanese-like domain-containing protein n=1 Tax=Chitinilyticum litopenaei TaxID=1121276 RepID=UPI00040BB9C1|nr:rhodanese-like domain-containing protein [Chitinilyticum litopenaei]
MTSAVCATGLAAPAESAAFFLDQLRFRTDSADLARDLEAGVERVVVIDTRKPEAYADAHIPGALSFPHWLMNEASTAQLDRSKVYVTYCVGIGCNGSTWGALKLARLGFTVKELIGGIACWCDEGFPVVAGAEAGVYRGNGITCAC